MADGSPWRRLRRIFRQDPAGEVDDELEFHLKERVRYYVARGMGPEAARRAAFERLGDLERVRSECTGSLAAERRAQERRIRLSISWLDVKLGVRMLVKYPGLSLVAVFGMALAIAIAATAFGAVNAFTDPTLPLDEGDRVIVIENHRTDRPGSSDRQVLHDFSLWRETLTSVRDLGAFRDDSRNLLTAGGSAALVRVVEMSASGFRVARIPPLLGRALVEEDEREGTSPVVVIAHEEWQRRFDGDPNIVGRTVRLGAMVHTVVGVMPADFRFPMYHRYWVPLRLNPLDYQPGGGPALNVFGRLADGVTRSQAQAELTAFGQRMAAASPRHAHLRPQIHPFTDTFIRIDTTSEPLAPYWLQLGLASLLIVVAVNVAVLVYARTATRAGEIAVRSALGASRMRVVAQLFVEALVLSVAAALVGLTIAQQILARAFDFMDRVSGGRLPFWIDFGLSTRVVIYGVMLAILGGMIAGAIPALQATSKRVQARLQQLASRGSQMQLGRTWTALIVVQVAIAVAVLPAAVYYAAESVRYSTLDPGYPADEFVSGSLTLDVETAPLAADGDANAVAIETRFRDRAQELVRRVEAEPGVLGVTFADAFPGREGVAEIEIDGSGSPGAVARDRVPQGPTSHATRVNRVGVDLFGLFEIPIIAGRGFVDADGGEGAMVVIVNRTFAERIAGGGNVVGRRVRQIETSADADPRTVEHGPWLEIVGVVPDFPIPKAFNKAEPKLYQPMRRGGGSVGDQLIVRTRRDLAPNFARRLRDISAAVDPALELWEMGSRGTSLRRVERFLRLAALGIATVTLSVLLLSAAGIYAMLSFTVARRRREIGIRAALGADPRRLLRGIFARAAVQLGTGVAAGLVAAAALEWGTGGWVMGGALAAESRAQGSPYPAFLLLPAVAAVIAAVGLLAALRPARRALSIQPSEALREE